MPEDTKPEFAKSFLWGASLSGHQVEGGLHDQWTVWELAHASELAKTAEKRLSWMPGWHDNQKAAQDPNNYISGKGVDHYNHYKEDFTLLKKLNLNSLRFSIEWARLEPEEGEWDQAAIKHYHGYIDELKSRGIEPVLNLWHWTHPVWFEDKGAFRHKANLKFFDRFVVKITDEFGQDIKHYITINEPNNYAVFGYLSPDPTSGKYWPPANPSKISFFKVYWHLVVAHKRAYAIIKDRYPQAQVGVASTLANIQAKDPHDILDELSTKVMRYFWNWWFLSRIRKYQDFVGINYYFTDYYDGLFKKASPTQPLNDMGWYMEPEGLYPLLLRAWAHYKKPIMVSENGVADAKDQYRRWWIEETIVAMERAMSQGVKISGYFHWSLLDNFEWAMGWWPRFGLIEVDRRHGMKRTVRPSAKWLAQRISKLSAPE
jgi:beta-glucosidase